MDWAPGWKSLESSQQRSKFVTCHEIGSVEIPGMEFMGENSPGKLLGWSSRGKLLGWSLLGETPGMEFTEGRRAKILGKATDVKLQLNN